MRRNLLFLCAAICSASLFLSCSNDDEPMNLNSTFGADAGTTLNLNYSNAPLSGKQVKFETTDNQTATLTLIDVIPGQPTTVIRNVRLTPCHDKYNFSGNTSVFRAAASPEIEYSGSIAKDVLTMNVNVKMGVSRYATTYSLADYATGLLSYNGVDNPNAPIGGALYIDYSCVTPDSDYGTAYGAVFRGIGAVIMPQTLKTITLEPDGNISAQYFTGNTITFDMMWAFYFPTVAEAKALIPTTGVVKSPKNIAFWYEKDGKIYVKLNIAAIMQSVMNKGKSAGMGDMLAGDHAMIKNLLNTLIGTNNPEVRDECKALSFNNISDKTFDMLIDWLKNGIPMNVKIKDGHTILHIDKSSLDNMFTPYEYAYNFVDKDGKKQEGKMNPSDIDRLWSILVAAKIIPAEYSMASMFLYGVSMNWDSATNFDLGLDMIAQ